MSLKNGVKLKAKKYAKGKKIKDLQLSDLNKLYDQRYFNRGRPPLTKPNKRDKTLLRQLNKGMTLQELGDLWGISKQRVHYIQRRWTKDKLKRIKKGQLLWD